MKNQPISITDTRTKVPYAGQGDRFKKHLNTLRFLAGLAGYLGQGNPVNGQDLAGKKA